MSDGLEVVSSTLLIADVSVNASVSSCACEILTLSEGYVFPIRVLVALSQPEVYDEHTVLGDLIAPYEEVVRLDVSVNDSLLVHFLDSLDLQVYY